MAARGSSEELTRRRVNQVDGWWKGKSEKFNSRTAGESKSRGGKNLVLFGRQKARRMAKVGPRLDETITICQLIVPGIKSES